MSDGKRDDKAERLARKQPTEGMSAFNFLGQYDKPIKSRGDICQFAEAYFTERNKLEIEFLHRDCGVESIPALQAAREREVGELRKERDTLAARLGKPRCLDCNAAGKAERLAREREEFEKWIVKQYPADLRHEEFMPGIYWNPSIQQLWEAWQASAALRPHLGERWIPVGERLPEIGTTVLAVQTRYGLVIMHYSIESARHRQFVRRDGQWWHNGEQVTHWRPLPAPPAEEER